MRIDERISALRERLAPRAKSLIVTIYGDSILPHGGTVWLGSLIRLVAPLGLNERMVRTAVFRLTRDDWLTSEAKGRRSYYGFSPAGRLRFEEAHRRIYAAPGHTWDGTWTLVLLTPGSSPRRREKIRRELLWRGFGQFAPGLFAHPATQDERLDETLAQTLGAALATEGAEKDWIVLKAEAGFPGQRPSLQSLVEAGWDLGLMARDYERFLDHFRPLAEAVTAAGTIAPETAFLIRTLLIHDYRRVLLRDPLLPDELLPPHWPGRAARILCRDLYRRTERIAERHIMAVLETADGPLPEAQPRYRHRFGPPEPAPGP